MAALIDGCLCRKGTRALSALALAGTSLNVLRGSLLERYATLSMRGS